MQQYLDLLQKIMDEGTNKMDRTALLEMVLRRELIPSKNNLFWLWRI